MTRIVVAGAGSIGCFVGGLLQEAGHDVVYLGRPRVLDALRGSGLHLTDFTGLDATLIPGTLTDNPAVLATAELVLVTVKSGATEDMARLIATHAPSDIPVISLQNGLENVETLCRVLPDRDVRAGMVPFNVVPGDPGHYHRTTSGEIVIAAGPGNWGQSLSCPAMPIIESDRITAVQWGKLLLNLTNAVNALSGLPLLDMLRQPGWRRLMADQMTEALAVLKTAGIPIQSSAPLPMSWVPTILRLPTPIYIRVAAQMLTIDPKARTSMAYDLMDGRPTEIDQLQGAILRLAALHGLETPIVSAVSRAVKSLDGQGPVSPALGPQDIRRM